VRLHDTTSTSSPLHGAAPHKATSSEDERQKVNSGIEAMFVRQMLEASHLFNGVGGHPMMQGMMLERLADSVVKGGSLGIGEAISNPGAARSEAGAKSTSAEPASLRGANQPHVGQAAADGFAPLRSPNIPHIHRPEADEFGIASADELMLLRPRHTESLKAFGGGDWSIDMDSLALPDDLLPQAAREAMNEGRISGLPRGATIDMALQRSWRPVAGNPLGDTGVIPLAQANSNAVLGEGPNTIRQVGCLLTSLTMVSNTLTTNRRSVEEANDIVTSAGGFRGVNMRFGPASESLGLRTTARGAFDGDTSAIDAALAGGKPVIVGVDFKDGSSSALGGTDHFLVITGKNSEGSYTGIDAANGRPLTFSRTDAGELRAGRYRLSEFITLEERQQGRRS
jgi:hypothetical protein